MNDDYDNAQTDKERCIASKKEVPEKTNAQRVAEAIRKQVEGPYKVAKDLADQAAEAQRVDAQRALDLKAEIELQRQVAAHFEAAYELATRAYHCGIGCVSEAAPTTKPMARAWFMMGRVSAQQGIGIVRVPQPEPDFSKIAEEQVRAFLNTPIDSAVAGDGHWNALND